MLPLKALREALFEAGASSVEIAKIVDALGDHEARIATLEARLACLERLEAARKKGGRPSKGGVHKVTTKGRVYWYAYKGGPRLTEAQVEFIRGGSA